MSQLEDQDPSRAQVINAVNRCEEAWNKVMNEPAPAPDADRYALADSARWEFLARLPILSDPLSFQIYFACLARGVVLGVIDVVDSGRYCHLAQLAMSAWKLAHPPAPVAKKAGNQDPLPSNGNHFEDEGNRIALSHLPDVGTQHAMYKSLRERGFSVPSNSHLRKNPMEALYYCNLAAEHLNRQPPLDDPLDADPEGIVRK